jgi:uncharacterized protein (TIGR00645 family)
MKAFELFVERLILASRWLLVVFYLGLAAALSIYAFSFVLKFAEIVRGVLKYEESEMILAMLGLIDAALVASLMVMVMISGYENFVGRFDESGESPELSWLGKVDAGNLKIKVASSIVAISSIHLLRIFLNAEHYANDKILWFTVLHLTFVVSALMLAILDRVSSWGDGHKLTASPDHASGSP